MNMDERAVVADTRGHTTTFTTRHTFLSLFISRLVVTIYDSLLVCNLC
jgi:hypothetical protein